jgi:phosphatidate phosphatase APP1
MTRLLDAMTSRPRPPVHVADEERVVLYPSVANRSRDGEQWVAHVHGDVSAAGGVTLGQRVLLKLLKRAMRAREEEFLAPLFRERIERFVAQAKSGVRVAVRIAGEVHALAKATRRNGHFHGAVRISDRQARIWADEEWGSAEACLPVEVCGTRAAGRVHLIEPAGLSIVTDIDDTIKHSEVACKRTLLTNTFLRPFEAIPGMAPLFREWSAEGAAIHYVSSSPWQLYEHLAAHLTSEGFPAGSFHLRSFRLRDHVLRRILMLRRSGKLGVIRTLFRLFPQRRFLLVGDSGEHDPEIYGALARRFPSQVVGILIRDLPGVHDMRRRYARAFRRLDQSLIRLYRDASELADIRLSPWTA